ncbi:MAG: Bpu10I family restriction endonuclease [Prevotella sp.]|nr:Bpu10I family restriction endonuclease [Prevotella sp.]
MNLKKYKVDQIFILRKMKNTDREFRLQDDYENKPIYPNVVEKLFNTVREHLTQEWNGATSISLESGMLL